MMAHIDFIFSAQSNGTTYYFVPNQQQQRAWQEFEQQVFGPAADTKNLAILGLPASAPKDEIKKKYRELVKTHHPDVGGDPAKFMEIQHAYEELMR